MEKERLKGKKVKERLKKPYEKPELISEKPFEKKVLQCLKCIPAAQYEETCSLGDTQS